MPRGPFDLPRAIKCAGCDGEGRWAHPHNGDWNDCTDCNGTGYVWPKKEPEPVIETTTFVEFSDTELDYLLAITDPRGTIANAVLKLNRVDLATMHSKFREAADRRSEAMEIARRYE